MGSTPRARSTIVTKSGGNTFHGDAFEFLRNGDVNARNFFAPVRDNTEAKPVWRHGRED